MTNENIVPVVGMGATLVFSWGDCYALTIVEVNPNGKEIKCTYDLCRNKATWPEQDYAYTSVMVPEEGFVVKKVTRGKNKGNWTVDGRANGSKVILGFRKEYRNPEV